MSSDQASESVSAPTPRRVGRPKDHAKREAILKAAHDLFVAHGYAGTNMDAVAAKAGVSKLTIYSHYMNKSALFQAVIHSMGQKLLILRNPKALHGIEPETALLEIARSLLNLWLDPEVQSLHRIMMMESVQQSRSNRLMIEAGPARTKRELAALLTSYHNATGQTGLYDFGDVDEAVGHFRALLRGDLYLSILLRLRSHPTEEEIDRHTQNVVRLFLRAYRR